MKRLIFLLLGLTLTGCGGESVKAGSAPLALMSEVPMSAWGKLSQKRIYFGHQSVGANIIIGIEETMKSNPSIKLRVVTFRDIGSLDQPGLVHEEIGRNDYPLSKTTAFRDRLQSGLGDRTDIAFLKFCFWDIRSLTDVRGVFENYKETISALRAQYPKTTFVHFTVPLMAYQTGIVVRAKRLLNLPVEWDMDNIKRSELNALILQAYAGKEPLFDIARIESTLPDGRQASFSHQGKSYSYLAQEYTTDGGHLNEEGRQRVAEQLLITLAHVAESL